jgi:hypothetical protein
VLNKSLMERTALGAILMVTPMAVAGQEKTWTGQASIDGGFGQGYRRDWGSGDFSADVTAQFSFTSYTVRPTISAAVETHAYGCIGECDVRATSGWFGAGAVAVFRRESTAQPFIGAEVGSFRWERSDRVLAWHGAAGVSFGSGRLALRALGRLRHIPALDRNQLHGALGLGVRF